MLLDISLTKNYIIIDQLALDLVDICIDNTLQILCKSLLCFAKIGKIDYSKFAKIWLVKFVCSTSKHYISLSFQRISTILISKSKLGYALFKIKDILKIKQNTFVL